MDKKSYEKEFPLHLDMRKNVSEDPMRLRFHLMPPTGWMNDPNGLCQLNGVNHVYFQYTPFLAGWGTKLWGHYTTRDWIHFQEEEPFLFPDCPWDRDGVYSGSAFVKDGEIHYFYTGNVKLWDQDYDYIMNGREQNTIHLTSRDGLTAGEKHLVLTNEDYPQDMSKHVRDPKIFCRDGKYYMVLGARDARSEGCALLYRSEDLEHWEYLERIRPEEPFGFMWECPDLFEVDGQTLLTACPQGIPRQGHLYQNVYQCGYFPIELDLEHKKYHLGPFKELDKGFDIYAPQTFEDEQGRRILIGWMGIPDADYSYEATVPHDWIHAMTMPRVLHFRNGKVYQQPLPEMKELRKNKKTGRVRDFGEWTPKDCCFEMKITTEEPSADLTLQLREDVTLSYEDQVLTLSMGKSGWGRTQRTMELEKLEDLTVFSDTSSIEIFVNGGEEVMTTRVYSDSLIQQVRFLNGEAGGFVEAYELDGFQVQWK